MEKLKPKEIAMTQNKQPVKQVSYQDIHCLNDTLDQIHSWTEALSMINNFFDNNHVPLNKKKITKDFHANACIFAAFYEDFLHQTTILEKQLTDLKARSKVKS